MGLFGKFRKKRTEEPKNLVSLEDTELWLFVVAENLGITRDELRKIAEKGEYYTKTFEKTIEFGHSDPNDLGEVDCWVPKTIKRDDLHSPIRYWLNEDSGDGREVFNLIASYYSRYNRVVSNQAVECYCQRDL